MSLLHVVIASIIVALVARLINRYLPMPDNIRPIVNIVLASLVVGMVLWLINTYVPTAGSIKAILNIVVVAATCVRVLQAFGLWSEVTRIWRRFTGYPISQ